MGFLPLPNQTKAQISKILNSNQYQTETTKLVSIRRCGISATYKSSQSPYSSNPNRVISVSRLKSELSNLFATPKPSQSSKLNLGALLSVPVHPSRPIFYIRAIPNHSKLLSWTRPYTHGHVHTLSTISSLRFLILLTCPC